MSVKLYSRASAAATRTRPDFSMMSGAVANAATARPMNRGDSELLKSRTHP